MNQIELFGQRRIRYAGKQRVLASLTILIVGLSLATLLTGCGIYGVGPAGSGNVVTLEQDIKDFTRVEASSAFDVTLTQSNSFKVVISTDDNLQDRLRVRKEGDTLKLDLAPGSYRNIHLRAEISMPTLSALVLSGASTASLNGFNSNQPLEVNLSGASRLSGDIRSGDMRMEASGASDASLSGSAGNLDLRASGSSDIDLADLDVVDANVRLSGASDATVNPSGRLTGEASGASTIWYTGNPELGRIDTSGASDIKQR